MLNDEQRELVKSGVPFLFNLKGVHDTSGKLSYWENNEMFPEGIKRCFWVYEVETNTSRGNHAHYRENQVIIAMNGTIQVDVENTAGQILHFVLDHPSKGLFLPPKNWISTKFEPGAVLMGMCNEAFKESDYIRDRHQFKCLAK